MLRPIFAEIQLVAGDVGPAGARARVAAPAGLPVNRTAEVAVAGGKLEPVAPGGVVAQHVGLSIAVDVGPVGPRSRVAAPAAHVVAAIGELAVAGTELPM